MNLVDAKRKEYKDYIDEHIENVYKAYTKLRNMETILMAHFKQISPEILDNLRGRVLKHDETKYWESEFEPYRKYFYPANTSEGKENKAVVDMFNTAWEHHYKHNDHHPEYWVENDTPSKMSTEAALEMICDWIAMSIKFNNRAIDWYTDNKDNIKFHDETRKFVEKALDIIYSYID